MNEWLKPVYKKLADSELGAGHTSGIVPAKDTQDYFGKPSKNESHLINTITIEFWYGNKSKIIRTKVNYFLSKSHQHIHLTGNLLPTYKSFGAEVGDIIVFWKSKDDETQFKAELIKPNSERWQAVKGALSKAGGHIELLPPGLNVALSSQEPDEAQYQIPSDIEREYSKDDFPPELRKAKVMSKGKAIAYRSPVKGNFVLKLRDYKCEVDPSHKSFLTPNGFPYMEKHHLIPMKYYDDFEYSLDDINNIVSICATCHRQIHHGKKEEIAKVLKVLWDKHSEALKQSHLEINLEDLKKKYSIKA